jgi:alkylation response protein AidB-like acyl-CoA dehydrogenase
VTAGKHPFERLPHAAAMDQGDEEFRAELRGFLADHPAPPFDSARLGPSLRESMAWQGQLAEHGYPIPCCPKEYGGVERGPAEQLIQAEEMAAVGAQFHVNITGISMLTPLLLALGTPEQRERWLPPVVAGRELWTQLFSEPGAGSDLFALRTKAVVTGDVVRITGQKVWNSWATVADHGLLLARTDPDSRGKNGISCFLVDMSTPGISPRPIRQMNGTYEFAEVFFDEAEVPLANMVGQLHQGAAAALRVLAAERGGLSMGFYALIAAEFDHLLSIASPARVRRHQGAVLDLWLDLALARLGAIRLASGGTDEAAAMGIAAGGKMGVGSMVVQLAHLRADLLGPRLLAHHPGDEIAAAMAEQFTGALALSLGGGTHEMQRNAIADSLLRMPR